MNWTLAENISTPDTIEGKIFSALDQLEQIRKTEKVFVSNADTWTAETGDKSVLCIGRHLDGDKIIGLFNFSESDKMIRLNETDNIYVDMISGKEMKLDEVVVPAYGFYYLKKLDN